LRGQCVGFSANMAQDAEVFIAEFGRESENTMPAIDHVEDQAVT